MSYTLSYDSRIYLNKTRTFLDLESVSSTVTDRSANYENLSQQLVFDGTYTH